MTQASICTIGDEILIGQVVDTNSSFISRELNAAGIRVTRMISIGDDGNQIKENIANELRTNEIVIVTGGLGPTKDDITKAALAELSGSKSYKEDARQLEVIYNILHSRGLEVLDINKAQALVPDTCEVIVNKLGTAPIMVFRFPQERFGHQAVLYSLPGVPFEAIGAVPDVMDDIRQHFNLAPIFHRSIMTYGYAESALAKKIEDWEDSLPSEMHLAYLPNPLTGVRLRLSVYGGDETEEIEKIDAEVTKLKIILGDAIYSDTDDTLENTVGRLLKTAGMTLSVAESCTGGTISSLITSVPGCSDYYLGSVTSYANQVKEKILGVPEEIIRTYGAVSSECVAKMAEGVRRITGSDFSVATSGIAGPGGGSEDKPVGLVWIGISTPDGTKTLKTTFRNDRKRNIERFAATALNELRKAIVNYLNH
ncbi:MAG: CinA family nicotinamide mononucleotide deamidase-related protein [Candidatus Cryptobacteroides sp.]